ncbi:uncharacterized protein LOC117120039 [Anneissia japonica]|uniref:uncharacterized protein LOC117120039 n=1 Tax=Anneissia japonica TaxID=1529436 RepID=UPI001425A7FB|nr:uncharacterized protein LOC117120039 [Anneissia japonica]
MLHTVPNTTISQAICQEASKKLRNHAISVSYSKQQNLCHDIDTSKQQLSQLVTPLESKNILAFHDFTYKKEFRYRLNSKLEKIKNLAKNDQLLHNMCNNRTNNLFNYFPKWIFTSAKCDLPTSVVNLSSYSPTSDEHSVLEKGLSFCPTRRQLDAVNLCSDMEQFIRRIRLKEYFKDQPETADSNSKTYKSPTSGNQFTPPTGRNPYIDSFAKAAKSHLDIFIQKNLTTQQTDNLTPKERTAMRNLRQNKDIVIKQADKGGAITLMDRSRYIDEVNKQLSDEHFYEQLPSDCSQTYRKEALEMVANLTTDTKSKAKSLIPLNPRTGVLYTIPKLHKLPKLVEDSLNSPDHATNHSTNLSTIYHHAKSLSINPPGRPIVSGNGTLTEHISGFVDSILNPLLPFIPSFVQDTTDFLRK